MQVPPGTVDVVVVGGGVGGCAAAAEAARAGAGVVVLEAGEAVGGNAARSTGYLAFADTRMQRDRGIADSADAFVDDMKAEVARQQERYGILFDEPLARRFAEESGETHDFLVDIGLEFGRFIRRPTKHTVDRLVDTVDVGVFRTGFEHLLDELEVPVVLGARARGLVVDDGRVAGVDVEVPGVRSATRVAARRAVVLATGGYQANVELRRRHQPAHLADTPYLGVDTARGDGHLMGQAIGGDLVNMAMIPPLVMVASAFVEDAIAVNRAGQRFHDEAGPYDDRVEALLGQPGRDAWYVYDDRVATEKAVLVEQMPESPISSDTVEGLADALEVDGEALRATIDRWAGAVGDTDDPDFGRVVFPASGQGVVQPPFHASRMVVGINFPSGGFRVTTDMEVVDVFGRTIAGLLAVGDCVGGVAPAIGLGGLKITPAVTLGRVAGRVAATEMADRGVRDVGGGLMDPAEARVDRHTRISVVDLRGAR